MLKCDICGKEFEERKGLVGLRVCEPCEESGKAGVASRSKIIVSNVNGKQKHVPNVIWAGSGVEVLNKED